MGALDSSSGVPVAPPLEPRGTKRDREEDKVEKVAVFQPVEMIRGCVIDICGLPADVDYHSLKDRLNEIGRVRFLELLDKDKEGEREAPVIARCRFEDPECAMQAMNSLVTVDDTKVEVKLLDGAEEEAVWDTVNAVLKERFDNPYYNAKGKGKGKGKGKSKGKGKKGKGKVDN